MANVNDKTISVLNDLIETCRDGENGFRSAAEGVKDPNLKALFNRYSAQRGEFASELQALVAGLGGDAQSTGSVAGAAHRGWINIKSAVTGRNEAAVVSEAERGEDVAKASYQKALQEYMSPEIRAVISRQYSAVLEAHDEVRRLEIQTHS
jgi:uncharacterized protein (TIGR02284 family)